MAGHARSVAWTGGIWLCRVLVAVLFVLPWPAAAAVQISFHSKDFGATFPHAFIVLEGRLDSTGEPVAGNYGFTVRHLIGPSVLFGPVKGEVISEGESYVASSNFHFAMTLTDERYRAVMEVVERWRSLPQPSYLLDRRNCVSFVAAVATVLGLAADPRGSMRRPRAFLDRVRRDNLAAIAAAGETAPMISR